MKTVFRSGLIVIMCLVAFGGAWLAPTSLEARGASWTVTVFNNPDLVGSPIWAGTSPGVSYMWGTNPPTINGLATGAPADNFSVRFTTSTFFTAGTYRFTVQVDDGARLLVDGALLINGWQTGALRTLQADYTFPADGNHTITVEMFDALNEAAIIVSWAQVTGPGIQPTQTFTGTPWIADFYNGLDLSGGIVFTNSYPPSGIDLNWGTGSPGGSVPADTWSARFTRSLNVPSDLAEGNYRIYARADDNFRFYIDNTLIMDYWDTFANTELYTADVTLLTGPHTFKVEYREREAEASLFLTWDPPGAQNPVLPPSAGGGPAVSDGTGGPTTGITATVQVARLNFRATPSLTGQVLTRLSRDTTYPATGRTGDNLWVQLVVDGGTGWVYAQYVALSGDINALPVIEGTEAQAPQIQPTGVRGMVMGNLRIREQPTTRSKQIGLMPWGTDVPLLGKDRTHWWYLVQYGDIVGWSYAPWIRITEGAFDNLPYMDGTEPEYPPPPATEGVVAQAFGNMRIRSGPGLQYPQIGRAVWGSRVQVLARSTDGRWYKVQHGETVGWTFAAWYRIVQGDLASVPVAGA